MKELQEKIRGLIMTKNSNGTWTPLRIAASGCAFRRPVE